MCINTMHKMKKYENYKKQSNKPSLKLTYPIGPGFSLIISPLKKKNNQLIYMTKITKITQPELS